MPRKPRKPPPTTPSGIKLSRPNVRLDTQTILPLLEKPKDAQQISKATQYPVERVHRAMMWAIEHGKVTTSIVFRAGTLVEMWKRIEEPRTYSSAHRCSAASVADRGV